MTYEEVIAQAKKRMGPYCKACDVCDGRACKNQIPGPGAKGVGDVAMRNYQKWKDIRVQMDTLVDQVTPDTTFRLFGKEYRYPIFAGPVGAMTLHYGDYYTDEAYNDCLVSACAEAGIASFTGDGANPEVYRAAARAIQKAGGAGIPTIKPWNKAVVKEKLQLAKEAGAFAVAMDIDAAGLPFLKGLNPPAGSKSVEELAEIIADCGVPFIVKGIMTPKGAEKARKAGAAAIVVSNHGGRVLDQTPATAEVLPEIVDAVGDRMKILVDGGLRSGVDVFKALSLGADAVVIARPYVTALYGGGAEGVGVYTRKIGEELRDTMQMCGAASLSEIAKSMTIRF